MRVRMRMGTIMIVRNENDKNQNILVVIRA